MVRDFISSQQKICIFQISISPSTIQWRAQVFPMVRDEMYFYSEKTETTKKLQ